jgi:peptidyl-tRNA hydrolase
MSQSEDGVAAWVLSRFSSEEGPFVEELAIRSALAVVAVVKEGLRAAQNRFNR